MMSRNKTFFGILGVITFALIVATSPIKAASIKAVWTSYGVGSCPEIASAHAQMSVKDNKISGPPDVWKLVGWVSGFATAANSAIGSPPNYFKDMTNLDIVNWVASFCRANPERDLDYAMRLLATDYKPF